MEWSEIITFAERHMVPCGIKSLTGWPCPGCGMQRAVLALLKGDLLLSVRANPALLPYLAAAAVTAVHLKFPLKHGHRLIVWLFATAASLMIVNYFARLWLWRYL